jgi:hypothetical protein
MPDLEQETAFVEAFIVPQKRERYKTLLANPKKRQDILERLNHVLDFIPALAQEVSPLRFRNPGVAALLTQQGANATQNVYIFSDVPELDGITLPLPEALDLVHEQMFGSIICCVVGLLAYYKPEDFGGYRGYILAKPARPEK